MCWMFFGKIPRWYVFFFMCGFYMILNPCQSRAEAETYQTERIMVIGGGVYKDQPAALYLIDPYTYNTEPLLIFPSSSLSWCDLLGIHQGAVYGMGAEESPYHDKQGNIPWKECFGVRPYYLWSLQRVDLATGQHTLLSTDVMEYVTGGTRIALNLRDRRLIRILDMQTDAYIDYPYPLEREWSLGSFSADAHKFVLLEKVSKHTHEESGKRNPVFVLDILSGNSMGPFQLMDVLPPMPSLDHDISMEIVTTTTYRADIMAHAWLNKDIILFSVRGNPRVENYGISETSTEEVSIVALDTAKGILRFFKSYLLEDPWGLHFYSAPAGSALYIFVNNQCWRMKEDASDVFPVNEIITELGLFRWVYPIQCQEKAAERQNIQKESILLGLEPIIHCREHSGPVCHWEQMWQGKVSLDGSALLWTECDTGGRRFLASYSAYDGQTQQLLAQNQLFSWILEDQLTRDPQRSKIPFHWNSLEEICQPLGVVQGFQSPGADTRKDRGKEMALSVKTDKPAYQEGDTIGITICLTATNKQGFWASPPVMDPQLIRGTVQTSVFTLPVWKWLPVQEKMRPEFIRAGQTLETTSSIEAKTVGDYQLRISYVGGDKEQWRGACRAECSFMVQGNAGESKEPIKERIHYLLEHFVEQNSNEQKDEVLSELKALGHILLPLLVDEAESYGMESDESEETRQREITGFSITKKQRIFYLIMDLNYPECFSLYEKWIKSENADERRMAMEAIGNRIIRCVQCTEKKSEGIALLLGVMKNGTIEDKRTAANYLTGTVTPEVREAFEPFIRSNNEQLRETAAEFCSNEVLSSPQKYGEAKERIVWFLKDDSPSVRYTGTNFFARYFKRKGYVYEADVEAAFQRFLNDSERFIRDHATDVLYERKDVPLDQWLNITAENSLNKRASEALRIVQELATCYQQELGPAKAKDWELMTQDAEAAERCKETLQAWAKFATEHPKYPPRTQ